MRMMFKHPSVTVNLRCTFSLSFCALNITCALNQYRTYNSVFYEYIFFVYCCCLFHLFARPHIIFSAIGELHGHLDTVTPFLLLFHTVWFIKKTRQLSRLTVAFSGARQLQTVVAAAAAKSIRPNRAWTFRASQYPATFRFHTCKSRPTTKRMTSLTAAKDKHTVYTYDSLDVMCSVFMYRITFERLQCSYGDIIEVRSQNTYACITPVRAHKLHDKFTVCRLIFLRGFEVKWTNEREMTEPNWKTHVVAKYLTCEQV